VREVILVPIKPFDVAKSRLRGFLADDAVDELFRRLARGVIAAARPRPCWVLCEDDEVATFAVENGASAVRVRSTGLNDAVHDGYVLAAENFDTVIIAHADLVHPTALGAYSFVDGMSVAPDRHGTGTNVLALPAGLDVTFHFGKGSAQAHSLEADRLGLPVSVIADSPWAIDIDEPRDLAFLPAKT
jgi:2-phospho-L-lactate/phosphoenolpyruvate guanylyltransferase